MSNLHELIKWLGTQPKLYYRKDVIASFGYNVAGLLAYMQSLENEGIPIISLEQLNLGNCCEATLRNNLKKLEKAELIECRKLSPEEKKNILSRKQGFGDYGIGDKQCEWCGCNTFSLNEHHYPVPRKDGGTEIVKICPNCHYDFHFLQYEYKVI